MHLERRRRPRRREDPDARGDERAGRSLRRFLAIAGWLVAHRRAVLSVSLALAVASAWLASRLPLHSDFADLLPPDAPSVRQLHALDARVQVPSTFMIGIESADPAARRAAFSALRPRLEALPKQLVGGVVVDESTARQFVWRNRFLFIDKADLEAARDAIDEQIVGASLDDGDGGGLDKLRARLDAAKRATSEPSEMISKDGRLQLVLVRARFADADTARAGELIAALEAILAEVRREVPGPSLGMTGDAISARAENLTLLRGMVLSTSFTVALVVGALALFYRTLRGVLALSLALAVGALSTFGFTKLAIGELNLASAFLSSIVVGNGVNFGLLLLARWLEEKRAGRGGVEAIGRAMAGTAPGTIAAAAAAAVAYGSLATTTFRGFRHFGVIGGVGMLLCWIATFTVLPALLSVFDARVRVRREVALGRWLAALSPRRSPWPVAGIALLVLVLVGGLSARFLTHDPLEDDLKNLRSKTPELDVAAVWMAKFDRAFGYGITGGFAIAAPTRQQAPAIAERLRAFDRGKPDGEHLFNRIHVLDDLLPKEQADKLALLAELRAKIDRTLLPRAGEANRRTLLEVRPPDDLRAIGDADVPSELAWPFTERDGTRGRVVLANNGLAVDGWSVKSLEHFARTVRAMNLGDGVLVGGSAFVFADMLESMARDGPRATALSAVGSLVMVFVVLGFGRYALVTAACGLLGTLGLLSAAWAIGLKVNFLDFIALPITIGIGIDYAANVTSRARQRGGARAGRYALRRTGGVVLLCSYTTVVGYASLLFSANRGIHSFGLSAMIGELTCISTALLFAPSLVDAAARLRARRPLGATEARASQPSRA